MYCQRCGQPNAPDASFCQKCGLALESEAARRETAAEDGRRDPSSPETVIFSVGPTLVFVKAGYALAALLGVGTVALLSALTPVGVLSVPIGAALLLVPAYKHLRKRLIRYTLTDAKIEIDSGFIVQNSRNVPLRSIQDVSVTSTVVQRLLGFGDLMIDNASEDGGKIVLKDIPEPKRHADLLLSALRDAGR